jgi:2-oxoglutarate ferredoxin oxidoreductase subunit alpha
MTFMTIPSTISGGPSIFQVRIGSGEVLSSGDEADVLLAFYQHSYETTSTPSRRAASCCTIQDHVEAEARVTRRITTTSGCRFPSLTVEAIGGTAKDKGKNMFALGLIAKMFDLNVPKLEKLITERFTGKDPSIVAERALRFHAGYSTPLGQRAGDCSGFRG